MVWKIQSRLPVLASKARTYPFALFIVFGVCPARCAEPTITASPATSGVAFKPELAGDEIDLLIVVALQIDDAALAEGRNRHAGSGVERDHPVAGRHVDDALVRSVGARPVRDASAGAGPRRVLATRAFVFGCASTAARRSRR